ncbi:cobalamin biosynthesis protein [Natrarchaeobius halalkaliphilus]|uniref:Cobalamin biosynthesis protein n=1 Tax=Natrarchaeobius halalkaliphilus TaxID=1679091 RepID=A0A3N6M7B4_9EURY|nr:cobalamin biosynthesis protein [Natrarchaeobius halalkaliphilus]RQG89246.1 cobalamin biosynthesis protein [Natrarchaeobius halalkaliphilus]
MSGEQATATEGGQPSRIQVPADPLAGHPATAYFWGHVAGSGDVAADRLAVVTTDEASARVLAAVAGGDVERDGTRREYAHDRSITRSEDEYTLSITPGDSAGLLGRNSVLGLPVDGRGNYRFDAFAGHDRELLRGLFEGCGTICFKSSSGTVGVSFVHDDPALLEFGRALIVECPVAAPTGDLSETASGGYWFGVDDSRAPAFGRWLYEDCEETGLFAPSRRRKLERSLSQADAYDET